MIHDNQIHGNFERSHSSEAESTHGTIFSSFLSKACWESELLVLLKSACIFICWQFRLLCELSSIMLCDIKYILGIRVGKKDNIQDFVNLQAI